MSNLTPHREDIVLRDYALAHGFKLIRPRRSDDAYGFVKNHWHVWKTLAGKNKWHVVSVVEGKTLFKDDFESLEGALDFILTQEGELLPYCVNG